MSEVFRAFWAVIPATVLDDMSIPANAKILYGVISTLTQRSGFCWATNAQLAEAMHCSEDIISRWVGQLVKSGHVVISVSPNRKDGGNVRKIYPALPEPVLSEDGGMSAEWPTGISAENPRGVGQKAESYIKNNIKNKKEKKKEKENAAPTACAVVSSLLVSCEKYGLDVAKAMQRFLTMRQEMKKPVKSKQAATMLWNKLLSLSEGDGAHMAALLDKATECQWLSLYQLKSDELDRLHGGSAPDESGTVDLSGLRFV